MPNILQIISKLPLPKRWKLEWHRSLLIKHYSKDIAQARNEKDNDIVNKLQSDYRYDMEFHEEDEDKYYTEILLRQARKLRIPIPHRKSSIGEESEFWYQGQYTGGWYLTNMGVTSLRNEVRSEINARHNIKYKWVVWVSALTGIIGVLTGLVAVLSKI